MILLACLLIIPAGISDDPYQEPFKMPSFSIHPVFRTHVGGWASGGFEFEAVRTDGKRTIEGKGVAIVGIEGGVLLWERLSITLGYEFGYGGDLRLDTVSLVAGWQMPIDLWGQAWLPNRVRFYMGLLYSTLDIDVTDFGTYDVDNFGFKAGLAGGWDLGSGFALELFVEFRIVTWEYKHPTINGDNDIGGGGVAGGVSLEFHF